VIKMERNGWDDKDTAIVTLGAIIVSAIVASVVLGRTEIALEAIKIGTPAVGGIATGRALSK